MPGPPDDVAWLTLNVYHEARGECQDGKAAVALVTLNRARRPYCSDGTIRGAILWPNAFSWTGYETVDGHYIKVAKTPAERAARAAELYAEAITHRLTWAACEDAAESVRNGLYVGGDEYDKLGDEAVLYLNPDPKLVPKLPAWAAPAKQLATIGHHRFYRS